MANPWKQVWPMLTKTIQHTQTSPLLPTMLYKLNCTGIINPQRGSNVKGGGGVKEQCAGLPTSQHSHPRNHTSAWSCTPLPGPQQRQWERDQARGTRAQMEGRMGGNPSYHSLLPPPHLPLLDCAHHPPIHVYFFSPAVSEGCLNVDSENWKRINRSGAKTQTFLCLTKY